METYDLLIPYHRARRARGTKDVPLVPTGSIRVAPFEVGRTIDVIDAARCMYILRTRAIPTANLGSLQQN